MKPSTNDINSALESIAAAERDPNHPRSLARAAVKQFQLDREKGEKPLGVTNIHDDKGAPVLRVDEVIGKSMPDYGRRK